MASVLGNYQIVTTTQTQTNSKERYSANPDCLRCKGIGWLLDFGDAVPCPEKGCMLESYQAYKKDPANFKARGVIQDQTFDNFIKIYKPVSENNKTKGNVNAFEACKALANGDAPYIWLLVYGGTGNGKTHLCYATTRAMLSRGMEAEMIASAELFSKIRQGIDSHESDHIIQHYKDIYALVIDDWGVGYGSDFERARFDEIMASRYENARVTVVTTNKDIIEIPERVRSRFEDISRSKIILNMAGDYRKVSR